MVRHSLYKWYVLTLAGLANCVVIGMAWTCMPVLFQEIAQDLNLSLVQLGTIWGMIPLAAIFCSIPGGVAGDRFGIRWVIGIGFILCAIVGAIRGASTGFVTLVVFMLLFGVSFSVAFVNIPKALAIFFPEKQLGLANGILLACYGVGGALALMISRTILSPALGGWRNVMFLYGGVSLVIGILWLLTVKERAPVRVPTHASSQVMRVSVRDSFLAVIRLRDVWLCALTFLGFMGGYMGYIGQLPMYLVGRGMSETAASALCSGILWASIPGGILMPLISDLVGLRKVFVIPSLLICGFCVFLFSILLGAPLWMAATICGFLGGAVSPLVIASVLTVEGVGPLLAGSAMGLAMTVSNMGGFLSPIIGAAIAERSGIGAFIFFGALFVLGGLVYIFVKETGLRAKSA